MPTQPSRRTFLKLTAAATSLTAADLAYAIPASDSIALITDKSALLSVESVHWALAELHRACAEKGLTLSTPSGKLAIVVAPSSSSLAAGFGRLPAITQPETAALLPGSYRNVPAILVTGIDARGLVYGLLELADRIQLGDDPLEVLHLTTPIVETTPNKVRSVARAFISEVEDKSWFYDRAFWTHYLDTLAYARFNRFNFALGFGYDFPRGVTGDYFHFPYPYLVELPAYSHVAIEPPIAHGERQRNLETLQFIAAETDRRGLEFQLGIWTHAYEWTDSPHADHRITGLTPETHAAYCRDALSALLKACPQITGLTLRIHGESGIPEGSYPFWQTLFEAIAIAGRTIEIDMHAKGLNQTMIDMAHKTGMPVKAGAKFWAEHLGLGYHQADIRAAEYPRQGVTGTFAVSSGARNFTRYGYGDFYGQRDDITLLYRVWPGTQHHLLWADPALASGYGSAAHFCGAAGMELCEPLTFKGREGSGHPGGRNAYADAALAASHPDTDKFAITYRVWGRALYNPESGSDVHQRWFRHQFGPSGPELQSALAHSSRILPLITTAWLPSASNHSFWPELYSPISILPTTGEPLYADSPAPHNVSAISPLDPQLFSTIDQHAADLLAGTANARYSPSEVIAWLEVMAETSTQALSAARTADNRRSTSAAFRQAEEDILILNGLGLYYANLFRAALSYSIHARTGDPQASEASLNAYRKAHDSWAAMAQRASRVYALDISYGEPRFRRGHWIDRLPVIEQDLTALEQHFAAKSEQTGSASTALAHLAGTPARPSVAVEHMPPAPFQPGVDLALSVSVPESVTSAVLWYRHVNHGERWLSIPMKRTGNTCSVAIPSSYTGSPYPLQYYFELRTAETATLHPVLNANLSNQPYFALMPVTV
ncbi:hypothetical protein [Acidicapsa acidisoli]|uniref:hypothetical protein n=1 Tax=Acidicapsa acidisoli TaxID=1615681 RepID=UPI0021E0BF04|nr:hypothetical protein [Acidicapsa acidisoli]